MIVSKRFSLGITAAALMLLSIPASAQTISFGGDEPIDIKAETAKYRGPKTILIGGVDIRQGTTTIYADKMDLTRAKFKDDAGEDRYGNINLMEAFGNFKYITPNSSVVGNKGVYERDKNIITVTGNVTYRTEDGNSVSGDRLIYDVTTDRAKFDGQCVGSECSDRVTINIGPKDQ